MAALWKFESRVYSMRFVKSLAAEEAPRYFRAMEPMGRRCIMGANRWTDSDDMGDGRLPWDYLKMQEEGKWNTFWM